MDGETNYFGRFLENVRNEYKIRREALSRGLCTESLVTRIEGGDRKTSKLLRDRLVERIGLTTNEYENYLGIKEYEKWLERQLIVKKIKKGRFDEASILLTEYSKSFCNLDSLERQFVLDMRAMLAKIGKEDENIRRWILLAALKETVDFDSFSTIHSKYLAPKEINILIEIAEISDKEIGRYIFTQLLNYSKDSGHSDENKVLFFPKLIVYYIGEKALEKAELTELTSDLLIINDALLLLKKEKRTYYLIELLEIKDNLLDALLSKVDKSKKRARETFGIWKEENAEALSFWKEIYLDNKLNCYMGDWTYFYWEQGVYLVNDIIRKRRTMFGLSRENLADGICSEKTLYRIENGLNELRISTQKRLFLKLNLSQEYQKRFISFINSEMRVLEDKISEAMNEARNEEALEYIDKLKKISGNSELNDKQYTLLMETIAKYRLHRINYEECFSNLYATINVNDMREIGTDQKFFSRMELIYMHNLVGIDREKTPDSIRKTIMEISQYLLEQYETKEETVDIRILELYLISTSQISAMQGNYNFAHEADKLLTKISLDNYRSGFLFSSFNERRLVFSYQDAASVAYSEEEKKKNNRMANMMKKYVEQ